MAATRSCKYCFGIAHIVYHRRHLRIHVNGNVFALAVQEEIQDTGGALLFSIKRAAASHCPAGPLVKHFAHPWL